MHAYCYNNYPSFAVFCPKYFCVMYLTQCLSSIIRAEENSVLLYFRRFLHLNSSLRHWTKMRLWQSSVRQVSLTDCQIFLTLELFLVHFTVLMWIASVYFSTPEHFQLLSAVSAIITQSHRCNKWSTAFLLDEVWCCCLWHSKSEHVRPYTQGGSIEPHLVLLSHPCNAYSFHFLGCSCEYKTMKGSRSWQLHLVIGTCLANVSTRCSGQMKLRRGGCQFIAISTTREAMAD